MIDFTRETVISLREAARRMGVTVQTVHNWAKSRTRGRTLETGKVGGARRTTLEALHRFSDQSRGGAAVGAKKPRRPMGDGGHAEAMRIAREELGMNV